MVNVRTRLSLTNSRTAGTARGVLNTVKTTSCNSPKPNIMDDSVKKLGKRSRWALDERQPSRGVDHTRITGEGFQTAEMCASKGVTPTSSFRSSRSGSNQNTAGMNDKQTRQIKSDALPPVPDEHPSGVPIKTEKEVVVVFL